MIINYLFWPQNCLLWLHNLPIDIKQLAQLHIRNKGVKVRQHKQRNQPKMVIMQLILPLQKLQLFFVCVYFWFCNVHTFFVRPMKECLSTLQVPKYMLKTQFQQVHRPRYPIAKVIFSFWTTVFYPRRYILKRDIFYLCIYWQFNIFKKIHKPISKQFKMYSFFSFIMQNETWYMI